MSLTRSTGTEVSRWPVAGFAAGVAWMLVGGTAAAVSWRDSTDDARLLVGTATIVGFAAVILGLVVGWRRDSVRWFAAGLIVSGLVMPTTFAVVVNLLPVVTGGSLLVWAGRQHGSWPHRPTRSRPVDGS